jgi:hypothetical protein
MEFLTTAFTGANIFLHLTAASLKAVKAKASRGTIWIIGIFDASSVLAASIGAFIQRKGIFFIANMNHGLLIRYFLILGTVQSKSVVFNRCLVLKWWVNHPFLMQGSFPLKTMPPRIEIYPGITLIALTKVFTALIDALTRLYPNMAAISMAIGGESTRGEQVLFAGLARTSKGTFAFSSRCITVSKLCTTIRARYSFYVCAHSVF